jgi:uncharacterized membrane protein HdeD (DUF308 family)
MTTASISSNNIATGYRVEEGYPSARWLTWLAIFFLFGGLAAALLPMLATAGVTYTVGWAFVFSGALQLVHSFAERHWAGMLWQAIMGAILVIGGGAMLFDPGMALSGVTTLLGVVMIATAVVQIALGINCRPHHGWSWMIVAGIVAVGAAGLIAFSWPSSTDWVKSIVVGLSLMVSGASYLLMAGAAEHFGPDAAGVHAH